MDLNIQAIQEWPTVRSAQELQAFLGPVGYYRRFIKDFAKIAAPLYALTLGDTSEEPKQQAFRLPCPCITDKWEPEGSGSGDDQDEYG